MIMDGYKEQTLGQFKKKCQDADCRIKQTEPYSPWQNTTESATRELKKAAGQKMVCAGAPKPFWADAIVRKYARAEGVTLPPSEELCPSRGSNSPAAGA